MAEVMSTWGLDWSQFKKGAEGVGSTARRAGGDVDGAFGAKSAATMGKLSKAAIGVGSSIGVAVATIQFAREAMADYAKTNEAVADSAAPVNAAFRTLRTQIGRDYAYAVSDAAKATSGLGEALASAQKWGSNVAAGLLSGTPHQGWDVDAARIAQEQVVRLAMATREAAKYQGELAAGYARTYGAAGEDSARKLEEQYRHRDAMAEAANAKDQSTEWKIAMQEVEARRHVINVRKIEMDDRRRWGAEMTAHALAGIEVERIGIGSLKRSYDGLGAAMKANRLDREAARTQTIMNPGLSAEEQTRRLGDIDKTFSAKDEETRATYAFLSKLSQQRVKDMVETARAQRLILDGHKTEAALAQLRLGYEQQIRGVMRDENLTMAQKVVSAAKLTDAFGSVKEGAKKALLTDAYSEYFSALASQSYRTSKAGAGGDFSSAVFGPSGPNAERPFMAMSGQSTVEKNFKELQRAIDATGMTLDMIERNTRQGGVAIVAP